MDMKHNIFVLSIFYYLIFWEYTFRILLIIAKIHKLCIVWPNNIQFICVLYILYSISIKKNLR